jgi:hypothetical protein
MAAAKSLHARIDDGGFDGLNLPLGHHHPAKLVVAHQDRLPGRPAALLRLERIGRHAEQAIPGMHEVGHVPPVGQVAVGGRVLNEPAEAVSRVFDASRADVPVRGEFVPSQVAATRGKPELSSAPRAKERKRNWK